MNYTLHAFTKSRLVLLLFAIFNLIVAFTYVNSHTGSYITDPLKFNSDTPTYLSAIEFFRESLIDGEEHVIEDVSSIVLTRALTTPLMLVSSMIVGTVTGDDAFGMIFINIIFYLLLVPILYRIGILIFNDSRVAFLSTVLILSNWVLFTFGPTYGADMGGWFFFLLTTMFALEYHRAPTLRRFFYFALLSSVVGVFFKEYGALGISTLWALIALGTNPLKNKIKDLLISGIVFGTILFSYHAWFYSEFSYTYFGWYDNNYEAYADPDGGSYTYQVPHLIRVLALIFLPGWPLFLLGCIRFIRERRSRYVKDIIIVLLAMLPASLAFLAWPAFAHRIAFILIPWVALVAAYGLSRFRSPVLIGICLFVYILFSYSVDMITASVSLP